jgi:hypothetical protein
LYFQDDFKVSDQLKVTMGIRATGFFQDTALENPIVTGLTLLTAQV